MKIVTAEHGGRTFPAALEGDRVVPISGVGESDLTWLGALDRVELDESGGVGLDEVRLGPPVRAPGKIICVGLNYAPHVEESHRDLPTYPVLFTKFASSLIGPYDDIAVPDESEQVDFEGELAVIIGTRARRVTREQALDFVAGYAVANDVTMRDYQYKTHQWLQGKAWDRSTPVGPYLVTPDEIGDPAELKIELQLNGAVMQTGSTAEMIFDVATLVSTISEFTALEAGDTILTGTPSGVGYRRDPQVFLRPGDEVSVEIESLGRIENRITAEVKSAAH